MNPTTLTMAGHLAHAGAARPFACAAPAFATGYGTHQASSWTKGATAEIAALVVIDDKNRPPRPLSEPSP